jgi:S1-C subfamily serine protease
VPIRWGLARVSLSSLRKTIQEIVIGERHLNYKTAWTFTPFEGKDLNPTTERSRAVPAFGGTDLIQDIINFNRGKTVDVHSRGQWAEDRQTHNKDVDKAYREEGDEYTITKRLQEKRNRDSTNDAKPTEELWVAHMPGGKDMVFPSHEVAIEELRKRKLPVRILERRFAQVISGTDIIGAALQSCVMIRSSVGESTEIGAGFCLGGGIFVTCAHVVQRYDKFNMPKGSPENRGAVSVGRENQAEPAEIVHIDYQKDIAILKSAMASEALYLGDSSQLQQGDRVFAVGSPRGFENNVSDGIISGLDRSVFWYEGAPRYIFTDAQVLPGNSGGPLLTYNDGKVVGMVSMIVDSDKGLYGLNAAIPASYIAKILKELGLSK